MTYITSRVTSSRIDDEVKGSMSIAALAPGSVIRAEIEYGTLNREQCKYTRLRVSSVCDGEVRINDYTNSLSTLEIYQTDDIEEGA